MPCHILLISGSLRDGSTNTAALRAAAGVNIPGISTEIYAGMGALPHFNPDDDVEPLNAPAAHLRARLERCDAVLFATPEYAGALPGSFKNLLDWTVGGGTYGKPVAWINVSARSGAVDAHESLRKVLERTGTDIVDAACLHIPVPRQAVAADGSVGDAVTRDRIAEVLKAIRDHVGDRPELSRDGRSHRHNRSDRPPSPRTPPSQWTDQRSSRH